MFDTPGERTARQGGRGRAEGRAVTGGTEGRFGREEEEVVRIVNREVVAGFWGLGGIDTPSSLLRGGGTGRASSLWSQGHLSSEKLNSWGGLVMFGVVWSHQ